MKFVVALAFIGLGYTLAYYGASMWKRYQSPGGTASGDGIPFAVLVFGTSAAKNGANGQPLQTSPPFGASSGGVATSSSPTAPASPFPTGGKVQSA